MENPSNNKLKSNKMDGYKGQQTYLFKTSCCPQNRRSNTARFLISTASVFEANTADIFLCNFGVTSPDKDFFLGNKAYFKKLNKFTVKEKVHLLQSYTS